MIHPSEISRLAHRLKLGDKTIEKDYVLTWILLAIANSPLRDRLAFITSPWGFTPAVGDCLSVMLVGSLFLMVRLS